MVGKGMRIRAVPLPAWCKCTVDMWTAAAGITAGPVFRPVLKGGRVGAGRMTTPAAWDVVRHYGERIGVPDLARMT